MKLIYKGKFDGNPESIPCGEHMPGAMKFKEFDDPKKMTVFANLAAIVLLVALLALFFLRTGGFVLTLWGYILPLLTLFPHELLHAVCFKNEVYLYTYFKQGALFVVGPETMSKKRFIFLSLLPNVVFGFLPYTVAMLFPSFEVLGVFGATCIAMGAGDYYNVFNAATQMPNGAKTYMYQFNSYWYMP